MKVEPYVLDENDMREARRIMLLSDTTSNGGDITALRITFDDMPESGWLALFETKPTDYGDTYLASFCMLPVSMHDDNGKPLFLNMHKMSEVDSDFYIDADGFAKWDGCREVHGGAHVCDDRMFKEYMNALAYVVMHASRMAGYEGDGAE